MQDYFAGTSRDEEFFKEYIDPRLPKVTYDMHMHITDEDAAAGISPEMVKIDWALQCGYSMSFTQFKHYTKTLWGDRTVFASGFPLPVRGVDLHAANDNLYALISGKSEENKDEKVKMIAAAMSLDPNYDNPEECEKLLLERGFIGYKPYPDLVAGAKGAEIGIFDFIPDEYMKTIDRYKKAVILHLPRAKRLADPNNIADLLRMRQKYPDAKIVVAHYGRSYNIEVAEAAVAQFGKDIEGFYFDTSAVINPAVHRFMLETLPHDRMFYGTDMPILRWHGKRTWEGGTYHNHARERFDWNAKLHDAPEAEEQYTFLLYEQVKNMLDVIDEMGGRPLAEKVFCENGKNFLALCR